MNIICIQIYIYIHTVVYIIYIHMCVYVWQPHYIPIWTTPMRYLFKARRSKQFRGASSKSVLKRGPPGRPICSVLCKPWSVLEVSRASKYLSIDLSIYLSNYLTNYHLSIHPPIRPSIYWFNLYSELEAKLSWFWRGKWAVDQLT